MYLTEEEQKMPLDMQLLQYVLGIASCKTKGDVKELLKEIYDLGRQKEREDVFKEIDNMFTKIGKCPLAINLSGKYELYKKRMLRSKD